MTMRGKWNQLKTAAASTIETPWLKIVGARHNNLRNIQVAIPLGRFVCVSGVSGSGKSSLVNDILREALARDLNGSQTARPGEYDRLEGLEHLDKIIDIDQSPIGRTPRSNPATYIKLFDLIRDLYTKLPDSKVRGYRPGRFSFNVSSGAKGGGRCEACEGNGSNKLEMEFLADLWVTCPVCEGRRFSRETLQIVFKGKNIADVLDLDVQQALEHFANIPAIAGMLSTLHDVGLDYLKLGQPSTTLSGGEAQRIKLARELVKASTSRTLYLLDEPTTGLHFADVKKLLAVLHGFVDAGNTVLVIEHNLDVLKTADWIIDLGPDGGDGGGRVVAVGTPEQIAQCSGSYTGQALQIVLNVEKLESRKVETGKARIQKSKNRNIERDQKFIRVVGARQHNLKNIDVEVPRDQMTICTGPSGSGKSSFAIDTVYTEGQRRYVESLSAYARQFLSRLQPPKVDHVYGLSPAICIEQRATSRSPRSTVGTVTEVYDYMRVLWARIGKPFCPDCDTPIGTQTSDEIVDKILVLGDGCRIHLLAPIELGSNETYEHLLAREKSNGYTRARIDGVIRSLDDTTRIEAKQIHDVELVVDRLVIRKTQRRRLADSVEQALTIGNGVLIALVDQPTPPEQMSNVEFRMSNESVAHPTHSTLEIRDSNLELRFSLHRSCERCGRSFEELTAHHFSFNSRFGWCEACQGLGTQQGASPSAVVVRPTRSIVEGAIAGWGSLGPGGKLYTFARSLADRLGFDVQRPWNQLTESQRLSFLHGCGEEWIQVKASSSDHALDGGLAEMRFRWRGFFPAIDRATRTSAQFRSRLEEVVTEVSCEGCRGGRLRPEPAAVRLGDATLHEVCTLPIGRTVPWFEGLRLIPRDRKIAGELLHEITSRLRFLVDVGLDYLTLHRTASTLSGGEAQRIQLASQIGTGLTGVLYVLDEPTIGLHPRDNRRLIQALTRLRNLGNTLLVVEHDREVIASADHVLDFGPGAGAYGGEVTAAASPSKLRSVRASLTGRYLSGKEVIPIPENRRPVTPWIPRRVFEIDREPRAAGFSPRGLRPSVRGRLVNSLKDEKLHYLIVHGARENNLKEIDVAFPLGRFTCVTGVSGSGKSTLVSSILCNALAARLHRARVVAGGHERISGVEHVDKVINVDQSPIGFSPTSNPATYTGVFDAMRELYAKLPLSKMRGYAANRFSFNRPGGRCEACQGMGQRCIEMHFLPDVWIECENCKGARYVPETLEVRYRGKSIADVLDMPVSEALQLFSNVPSIAKMLQTLDDVGLGYVQLGQSAPTLSGGEAQRVKLATELGRPSTGKTLYILDEPTTGLHFDDLKKLLEVLHRLVDLGNTCICIEHNLDVIKTADWVIDLGPDGGEDGGHIVAEGTPEGIVQCAASHTGAALRVVLIVGTSKRRNVETQAAVPRAVPFTGRIFGSQLRKIEKSKTISPTPIEFTETSDVPMPWETNGQAWHTVDPKDGRGQPIRWDVNLLTWLVETTEKVDKFAPTDWKHRTKVEIPGGKDQPWFCHLLTGGSDLLEVVLRVADGTFTDAGLQSSLDIRTLDERTDLPIYGQRERARVRRLADGWQEVRLTLRDFRDFDKARLRKVILKATAAYFQKLDLVGPKAANEEPWKLDGKQWHLSQRSIAKQREIQWKPDLLLSIIGRLKSVQRDLELDWGNRSFVMLNVPGERQSAGKIITNVPDGLKVELRGPIGHSTPAQIDRLGEEADIWHGKKDDWAVFRIRSFAHSDARQLRDTWRRCRPEAESHEATLLRSNRSRARKAAVTQPRSDEEMERAFSANR